MRKENLVLSLQQQHRRIASFKKRGKKTLWNQFLGGSWRQESDGSQASNPLRATLLQKGKIVIPGQG
jgi:hypothetical protein